jgi:8-oxo-dGTP pyrophosphatase MutT (NUDIX family)
MTVSGFVVHDGRVALHWHRKIGKWLPAGGHIEQDEDPIEAVVREVREEFALEAEVMQVAPRIDYGNAGPKQHEPPIAVLEYEPEPGHFHVDLVYFLRAVSGYPGVSHDSDNPVHWLDHADLATGAWTQDGVERTLPADVQALALEAIRRSVAAGFNPQTAMTRTTC